MLDAMTAAVATLPADRPPIDPTWLVAAQEAQDVSSAALARALEVDSGTVYKWRTGRSPINRVTWLAILTALQLPTDWKPPTSST